MVIDMQGDFVRSDGWFASLGIDVSAIQAVVPRLTRLLLTARRVPDLAVVHTRQGNATNLRDLPLVKQEQGRRTCQPIGHRGPLGRGLIRGEEGWQIIPQLAPVRGEVIVDKSGFSAFVGTDLEAWLKKNGRRSLIIAGVTANVCVLATLYGAVDRGFDCLLLADGVAGATPSATQTLLDLVRYQTGLFGSIATVDSVVTALAGLAKY